MPAPKTVEKHSLLLSEFLWQKLDDEKELLGVSLAHVTRTALGVGSRVAQGTADALRRKHAARWHGLGLKRSVSIRPSMWAKLQLEAGSRGVRPSHTAREWVGLYFTIPKKTRSELVATFEEEWH